MANALWLNHCESISHLGFVLRECLGDSLYLLGNWDMLETIEHDTLSGGLAEVAHDHVAKVAICCQQKLMLADGQRQDARIGQFHIKRRDLFNVVPVLAQSCDNRGINALIRQNIHALTPRTSCVA